MCIYIYLSRVKIAFSNAEKRMHAHMQHMCVCVHVYLLKTLDHHRCMHASLAFLFVLRRPTTMMMTACLLVSIFKIVHGKRDNTAYNTRVRERETVHTSGKRKNIQTIRIVRTTRDYDAASWRESGLPKKTMKFRLVYSAVGKRSDHPTCRTKMIWRRRRRMIEKSKNSPSTN